MPSIFARLKSRDGSSKRSKKNSDLSNEAKNQAKLRWEDAWARTHVEPEEVQELIRRCTEELKARSLDLPFLLLPFRPTSNPSAVRTFIRHFFDANQNLRGDVLVQELRMNEPMVLSAVIKWCWARLQGGIVGWESYELFKVGEQDSNFARDSFKTFIPLSVDNGARSCIIFDFFDLLSAIAAHGKSNGFGGRKLSRTAAWWAFEHSHSGTGFEGGYNSWLRAADAASHLFFAYLRSLSPPQNRGGISLLPMSLQKLMQETEYPPQFPSLMQTSTNRVVMVVDTVSPTPFALLRRANHFQYREENRGLCEYAEFEDPVQALTEECRRVLRAIAAANQSQVSSAKHSTNLRDASWSRFEDIGFSRPLEEEEEDEDGRITSRRIPGLRTFPSSGHGLGRPMTPSWADFLSSGFSDDAPNSPSNMLLPPDKVLPPIDVVTRQRSSRSHNPQVDADRLLEPGELASIHKFDLDDAFWWVWISSLAPEETAERKSVFGRCAIIETIIRSGRWLVMEEMVIGAAPEPQEGAYIAEKKRFFSWRFGRSKTTRRRSTGRQGVLKADKTLNTSHQLGLSKISIGPDQHARIQAAAAQLQARQKQERLQELQQAQQRLPAERRGRADDDTTQEKTNSVLTLQPVILTEASSALKWANKYDKEVIRDAYLANSDAGRGAEVPSPPPHVNGSGNRLPSTSPQAGMSPSIVVPDNTMALAVAGRATLSPDMTPLAPSISSIDGSDREFDAINLSEKALEAPNDVHPIDRPTAAQGAFIGQEKQNEIDTGDCDDNSPFPEQQTGAESRKHNRLHKENREPKDVKHLELPDKSDKDNKTGGLRTFFGKSKRGSKLPHSVVAESTKPLYQGQQTLPIPVSQVQTEAPVPVVERDEGSVDQPVSLERPSAASPPLISPVSPASIARSIHDDLDTVPQPILESSALMHPWEHVTNLSSGDSGSHADRNDADEARDEFARFDQGPLVEQPSFAPTRGGGSDDDEDTVPPPIARHAPEASPRASLPIVTTTPPDAPQPAPAPESAPAPMEDDGAALAQAMNDSAQPPTLDRWAKIRRNAERAAERQGQPQQDMSTAVGVTRSAEAEDDTVAIGEETIESRVARIKARVAELTSNIESGRTINGTSSRLIGTVRE